MSGSETTQGGRSAAAPKRWLRFSLRTLVLAVLLVGSGATLWWNWGPWILSFDITEPGEIVAVHFTVDEELVVVQYRDREALARGIEKEALDVLSASSGKRVVLLEPPDGAGFFQVQGDFARLAKRSPGTVETTTRFYDLKTGQPLNDKGLMARYSSFDLHFAPNYLAINADRETAVVRLPEFEVIATAENKGFSEGYLPGPSFYEDRCFILTRTGFEIHDLKARRVLVSQAFDFDKMSMTLPKLLGMHLVLNVLHRGPAPPKQRFGSFRFMLLFFDVSNGKLVRTININEGRVGRFAHDGGHVIVRDRASEENILFGIESNQELGRFPKGKELQFSADDTLLLDGENCCVYDINTRRELWRVNGAKATFSECGRFVAVYNKGMPAILEARTGRTLMKFDARHWPLAKEELQAPTFARYSAQVVLAATDSPGSASVWRLRHPLAWYGAAWLPEFWLTVVLTAGLVWSIWRDRRIGGHM